MRCVYCELPEIKERVIIENKFAIAFPTNIPITIGHTLVLPKRCVENIEELTSNEVKAILELLSIIKKTLKKTYNATGFNIALNEGRVAGQNVPHVHIHVVPRKEGDSGIYDYEPRKFLYRPGSRETSPESEVKAISLEIKNNL